MGKVDENRFAWPKRFESIRLANRTRVFPFRLLQNYTERKREFTYAKIENQSMKILRI